MNIKSLTVFAAALLLSSAAFAAPVKQGQSSLGAVLTEAATALGLRLGVLYEATAPPA